MRSADARAVGGVVSGVQTISCWDLGGADHPPEYRSQNGQDGYEERPKGVTKHFGLSLLRCGKP